ncbi:MAG: hypothetical protein N4A49_14010 [Marinifilaceae bacterium]|jgi:hypothetical protein|nr:hypothetical protein [Marinifilaceae bacterium]
MKVCLKKCLVLVVFVLPFLVSCNRSQIKQLKQQNLELSEAIETQSRTVNGFINTLNSIESNLALIKEKENILSVGGYGGDPFFKNKIERDMIAIRQTLKANKKRILELEAELAKEKAKNIEPDTSKIQEPTDLKNDEEVERLKIEVAQKNNKLNDIAKEIVGYRKNIANLNKSIGMLKKKVELLQVDNDNKKIRIDSLEKDLVVKGSTIANLGKLVDSLKNKKPQEPSKPEKKDDNSWYYVIAKEQDLISKNILVKKSDKLELSEKMSDTALAAFTKVEKGTDVGMLKTAKGVKVISIYPSFTKGTFRAGYNKKEKACWFQVTNKDEFWSKSKYLVICEK